MKDLKGRQDAFLIALRDGTQQIGMELTDKQQQQCLFFVQLLLERNRELNLTSVTDPVEIAIKHFVDAFTCLMVDVWPRDCRAVDVGTGAGLPGIALAILRPDIRWVFIDALRKRVDFVRDAVKRLELPNAECLHRRAEDYGRESSGRETFDVAVARAVSGLSVLLEYCLPLVKLGGNFLAMKGPDGEREIEGAKEAAELLGAAPARSEQLILPYDYGKRVLIWYEKKQMTPSQYPRRPGMAVKRPLK